MDRLLDRGEERVDVEMEDARDARPEIAIAVRKDHAPTLTEHESSVCEVRPETSAAARSGGRGRSRSVRDRYGPQVTRKPFDALNVLPVGVGQNEGSGSR